MKTVFVRLNDSGSAFHCIESGTHLAGKGAIEIKNTTRVQTAIKGGHLVKLKDQEEVDAWHKLKGIKVEAKAAPAVEVGVSESAPKKAFSKKELLDKISSSTTANDLLALTEGNEDPQIKRAVNDRLKKLEQK